MNPTYKIIVYYDPAPVPSACFDWCAYDDNTYGGEPNDPIGYGATALEAIEQLLERLEDKGL